MLIQGIHTSYRTICNDAWINKAFRIGDLELDVPQQLQNVKVVALVYEFGMWNMEFLRGRLPTYIINKIAVLPPPSNIAGVDVLICMENTTGKIVIIRGAHNQTDPKRNRQPIQKNRKPQKINFFDVFEPCRLKTDRFGSIFGL